MENNDRFNSGCPGIGMEVAEWVVRRISASSRRHLPTEVIPNPTRAGLPVHGHLLTKHGILNFENLTFDEVVADGKYRFLFMYTPVPIKGATGSIGCPIAIT
jgi:kynurenine formamidase